MNAKKQHVPKIRFEGFSENWESKKISDLSETTIGGGTPSTSVDKYWEGEIPWIQSSDIILDDVLNITPTKFITREALQNSAARLVPEDSLAIVTRVGVGKLCVLPYKYATSQDFLSLVNLNIDKFYIAYNLYRFLQEEKHKVQGTAIKGITKSDLLNSKVLITESSEEQTQIGNFFQQLDKLIELQTRSVESAETYKKAMLQKMFPQKGEKVPRMRFEGFSGDWIKGRLCEVVEINPSSKIPDNFNYVDLESVKGHSLIGVKKEYLGTAPSRAQRVARKNDVFYQTVRPYQRNNYLFELDSDDYVFSTGYAQLRPKNMISSFLFSAIRTTDFVKKVLIRCTGTSYPAINSTDLGLISILLPSLEEQTQIGNFFQKLDQNIESEKKKLEQYQTMKRAMLQQMFV